MHNINLFWLNLLSLDLKNVRAFLKLFAWQFDFRWELLMHLKRVVQNL